MSVLLDIENQRWNQLSLFGITQAQWHSQIRELFSWVHTQRAEREGKSRWVDKTPGYALILDFIDELYPDCQVIHLLRDPHRRDRLVAAAARPGQVSSSCEGMAVARACGARIPGQASLRPFHRSPLRRVGREP